MSEKTKDVKFFFTALFWFLTMPVWLPIGLLVWLYEALVNHGKWILGVSNDHN